MAAGVDPNERWMGTPPLTYQLAGARRDYNPENPRRHTTDPALVLANLRILIAAGADPNPERVQPPPLYHALKYCLPDIVDLLLASGANPHASAWGDTPMPNALAPYTFCPSVDDQYRVTRLLLDHIEKTEGRDAMQAFVRMDSSNHSILHVVAWQKYYGVLAAFIEKGVDLDTQVKKVSYLQQTALEMFCAGCTALHIAEGVGHTDIADALRRAGARQDILNDEGKTPEQWRGRLLVNDSATQKAANVASLAGKSSSGNIIGVLKMSTDRSMLLSIESESKRIDKDPAVLRREGGPVYPPAGWQGLERAISLRKKSRLSGTRK